MLRISLQSDHLMKPIPLKRFPWCCTTNLELARQGTHLRKLLRVKVLPIENPLRVIQSVIDLPVGDGFFSAILLNPPIKDMSDSQFIRIKSHRKRHVRSGYSIIVPNFTATLDEAALSAFAQSDSDSLMREITNIIHSETLPRRSTWNDFLSALDASTLGMGYSASLISYLNFVDDFAVPSDTETTIKNCLFSKRSLTTYHSCVREILSGNEWTRSLCSRWYEEIENRSDREATLIRIALFYAYDFTKDRKSYARFKKGVVSPGTDRTYLMEFPRAFELLVDGTLVGNCDGPLRSVVEIMRGSGFIKIEHPNAACVLSESHDLLSRVVNLWTPQQLDQAIDYPSDFNTQIETETSEILAINMTKILLRNALVRFDALSDVRLSDFKFSRDLIEWRIRSSKGKTLDLPFPLSLLTPDSACKYFRRSWQKLIDNHGGEARLLELSGVKIDKVFKSRTYSSWNSICMNEAGTHISRIAGITWLPLRVLCLHYPEVRQHPSITEIVKHEWFSDFELEKLRILFPSPSVDTIEVIRLLVGWENKRQFFQKYFRINHILLNVHRDLKMTRC